MKYIRTKDGHYGWIMTEEKRQELIACANGDYGYIKFDIPIEKKADTIEELCDEFVVIGYEKTLRPHIIYGQNIKKFCQNNKNYCDIYGAIWTEWGLKYVAKMNDRGVLELI